MSYANWFNSKRRAYSGAITSAYNKYLADSGYATNGIGGDPTAWDTQEALAYYNLLIDATLYDTTEADDGDASTGARIKTLMPPDNMAKFYGTGANASEFELAAFELYLENNPVDAGKLGLKSAFITSDGTGRKPLGAGDNFGGELRKWKGKPQYTYAGGMLVGKDDKIIAAFGTNKIQADGADADTSPDPIPGAGADTLIFFDGVPGSKGSSLLAGTAVFAGDVVVSGSIQGDAGIVIIDDVIQLEQLPASHPQYANPAGLGVDPEGKIRLRHRGEGFLDLIDEDERRQVEDRVLINNQNTSSARYGTSLIPNSNFSYLETPTASPGTAGEGARLSDGTYVEQIASIATVGTTTSSLTYTSEVGIAVLNYGDDTVASPAKQVTQALTFQAVPISSERYQIRIRYKGSTPEALSEGGITEGLFLEMHETTVEDINADHSGSSVQYSDKFYIHSADNATLGPAIGADQSDKYSEFHLPAHLPTSGTRPDGTTYTHAITVTKPALSFNTDAGLDLNADGDFDDTIGSTAERPPTTDGISIDTDYKVKTFIYTRSSDDVKNASLKLFTQNYAGVLRIDYIVMTEAPPTNQEVQDLASQAAADIANEVDNELIDARMADSTKWAALNSTLEDTTDGVVNGDEAVRVTIDSFTTSTASAPWGRNGILSSQTPCETDTYIVGVRLKVQAADATTDPALAAGAATKVSLFVVENNVENYSTFNTSNNAPITDQPGNIGSGGAANIHQKTVITVQVDDNGVPVESLDTATSSSHNISPSADPSADDGYINLIGTYKATKRYYFQSDPTVAVFDYDGDYANFDIATVVDTKIPSTFCLGLETEVGNGGDGNTILVIDYFYCKVQSSSVNLSATLANEAYTDAEGFVTAMNELLVQERGSLISNASMSSLNSAGIPSGYNSPNTLALVSETDPSNPAIVIDRQIRVQGGTTVDETTDTSGSPVRYLVSPPFQLGSADKFSIGVLAKNALTSGTSNIKVHVAYLNLPQLPTGYETIGIPTSGGSDVTYAGGTKIYYNSSLVGEELELLSENSGLDQEFESKLATWDRTPPGTNGLASTGNASSATMGAIIIESNDDFLVDYILVKEQTCSYDLADSVSQARRDEAIAQATQELNGLNNAMNQETGSLLANSTFAAYDYVAVAAAADNGTGLQHPKNWALTRSGYLDGSSFYRVVSSTEGTTASSSDGTTPSINVPGEILKTGDGLLGGGAYIRHSNSAGDAAGTETIGILSSYFTLPIGGAASEISVSTGGSTQTTSPTGRYLVAIQFRSINAPTGSEKSGIRILAHETFAAPVDDSTPPNNVAFAIATTDHSSTTKFPATVVASEYDVQSTLSSGTGWSAPSAMSFTEGRTTSTSYLQKIQLINLSNSADVVVGFDTDGDSATSSGDDKHIETWTDNEWHTVGGTYNPTPGMRYVCFEFIFETTQTASEAVHVIDYVTLTPQTIDADFADVLAQARSEEAIDALEAEEAPIGNLIQNPFFSSANAASPFPNKWVPYSASSTGANLKSAATVMSFANTANNTGLKIVRDGSSQGIVSRAFRTNADDYLIELRARLTHADTDAYLEIDVIEFDGDIEDNLLVAYHDRVHSSYHSIAAVPTRVTSKGTLFEGTSTNARANATSSPALSTSYQTWRASYIPTSTCKFASVKIHASHMESGQGFEVYSLTCVPDTTASGNRLFGDYRAVPVTDLGIDGISFNSRITLNDAKYSLENLEFYFVGEELKWRIDGVDAADVYRDGNPTGPILINPSTVGARAADGAIDPSDLVGVTAGSDIINPAALNQQNIIDLLVGGSSGTIEDILNVHNEFAMTSNGRFRFTPGGGSTYTAGQLTFNENGTVNQFVHGGQTGTLVAETINAVEGLSLFTNFSSVVVSSMVAKLLPFTAGHDTVIKKSVDILPGLILESTGEMWHKLTKENFETALPKCRLSDTNSSKAVYGVVAGFEASDEEKHSEWQRNGYTLAPRVPEFKEVATIEDDEWHIATNSLGEGVVWVTNINGEINNGDFIESSVILGHGRLQEDDIMRSRTVAKCTEQVDWSTVTDTIEHEGVEYKKYLIGCTYHCG